MGLRTIKRLAVALLTTSLLGLLLAPVALAGLDNGGVVGEGLYGETNDRVVTNFGFAIIAFFPLLILVLSVIQWRLEKRRDARHAAARSRKTNAYWQGGW